MNERIRQIRKESGLSQDEFGKRIKIGKTSVSKLESGENRPSSRTIFLICEKFNINEEWLVNGTGEMYAKKSRNQEILEFSNDVMESMDSDFRKRLVLALSRLDENDWKSLEKIVQKLVKES